MRRPETTSMTLAVMAVSLGLLLSDVVRAQDAARSERRHPDSPSTYGTGRTSLYRIGSMEFQPLDSGTTYADLAFGPSSGGPTPVARFTTVGGSLVAVPHLPGGALLTGAELDFCDSNPDQHVHLFVDTASSDGTGLTAIGSISSSNVNGCGKVFLDLTAANYTINNNSKELIFLVFFDAFDGTNALSGVIVHYQLQVSPAPATATFADVPTSNPFFRVIEALAKAGITSGCGGGNFCPDQTVTRGKLAKFFAVALGLQFE